MSRTTARRSRHRSPRARTTSKAIGLTLLSALIPGSGLVMGGRKRLGAFVLTISIGLLVIGAYVGLTKRDSIVALAVSPRQLLIATAAVVLLGVCWIWVVVTSYKLIRPVSMTYTGRLAGSLIVASIDTKTGDTALISLSRNWMRMPFPEDSPLHKVYPDGYWDPKLGNVEQPEY